MHPFLLTISLSFCFLCYSATALPSRRMGDVSVPRMDTIKSMYAFEGFAYPLDNCPSSLVLQQDFSAMVAKGARNVITFDLCGNGSDASYYGSVIRAAGTTGLKVIPLVWTLLNNGDDFASVNIPRIDAVTQAVINNPGPVLAVALGDEPLFDNDFGSADNLAVYIRQMKSRFAAAGLPDIPVSISDLAYGWQSSGNITAAIDAVDFFMINNFPYFAFDAQYGNSLTTWSNFMNDMNYYASIANGKPLLVTQTGWPSNKLEYAPNSPAVVATLASEQAYWNLLDSHCEDFFKPQKVGWMWRSWDDSVEGWGVTTSNDQPKWDFRARTTC